MKLVEFGPDDVAEVDTFLGLARACGPVDSPWWTPPTRFRQQMELRYGWDGEPSRAFLAYEGDDLVGSVDLFASEYDNLDTAWAELQIAPDRRRRGLGRALIAQVESLAVQVGRPSLIVLGTAAPGLSSFAESVGYPERSIEVLRHQALAATPEERARFEALRAEAEEHSPGYDLLRIEGRTPPEHLDGLVRVTEAINDAPNDDLDYADQVFDTGRISTYEDVQVRSGFRFRRIVALERATGELVGHTVISVDSEQPAGADQHDTSVVPGHRGHRLGLRLKADMLCWLADEEPELRTIRTENAESNDPMVGINERLGYEIVGRRPIYQRRL